VHALRKSDGIGPKASPRQGQPSSPQPAGAGAPVLAAAPRPAADTPLSRCLARAVRRRSGAALQRSITIGGKPYTLAELTVALKANPDVVWHEEYPTTLAVLDEENRRFTDHGALMMELAGPVMEARGSPGPDTAVTTSPTTTAPAPPAVTLVKLAHAAPKGTSPTQRYDKDGGTHTSVTFTTRGTPVGVVTVTGLHRTLANGQHHFWNHDDGNGKFRFSTSSGNAVGEVQKSKELEDAWKAVAKVAKKLGCEALQPTWAAERSWRT
jgi:hypothetical protein